MMALTRYPIEPIMTAPRHQGLLLTVMVRNRRGNDVVVNAWWWRHWSMPAGVWWSPQMGVVDPVAWLVD